MPYGKRVFSEIQRPDPALVERFKEFNSADLCDAMNMAGTMDRAIGPGYLPMRKIVGPAVTVAVPTGAQNVRKMAMSHTQAGDVLVINGYGALNYAMLGANIGRGLYHRGLAGLVIDGAFRDVSDFQAMDLPIFSRGITTQAGPKIGPGEVNVPVACGGIVVNPGDIIAADEDGIVAIPQSRAEEILASVEKLVSGFAAIQDQLLAGAVTNMEAIEKQLRDDGFEFSESTYQQ